MVASRTHLIDRVLWASPFGLEESIYEPGQSIIRGPVYGDRLFGRNAFLIVLGASGEFKIHSHY
jgi:hypothetical protein